MHATFSHLYIEPHIVAKRKEDAENNVPVIKVSLSSDIDKRGEVRALLVLNFTCVILNPCKQ